MIGAEEVTVAAGGPFPVERVIVAIIAIIS